MPPLNWDSFVGLPGSVENNFEQLCKCLIRENYGSHGVFRALANQPGVECHLQLNRPSSSLGDPPRWWGWQCKWYDLGPTKKLSSSHRRQILDSLGTTEEYLPKLTDWVLWTRHILTKDDQEWFDRISSRMSLHLWTHEDVERLLTGSAEVFLGTFFGELVLTPKMLRERHERSVASIGKRWQPEVHQVRDAEHQLRRMLGETDSWSELNALCTNLRKISQRIDSSEYPAALSCFVHSVVNTTTELAGTLEHVGAEISSGDLDSLRLDLAESPTLLPKDTLLAPRKLRVANNRVAIYVTNAVAACKDALRMLQNVRVTFATRIVALLAPAGCGKTQMAAHLTANTDARPHGLLLHGRDLHAAHTLDDLARKVVIAGHPLPSMDALLAAVDAAGRRAQRRLPVCIDGLNEAEDPQKWKSLLEEIKPCLDLYPYVLLVVTLRPDFVDQTLPSSTPQIRIDDFGEECVAAMQKYFAFWKIDVQDAWLPDFLRHPLTLQLFCEVTNHSRQKVVRINSGIASLTDLFDRYLEQIADRIAKGASLPCRFDKYEVQIAITRIANRMWDARARLVGRRELLSLCSVKPRSWSQSIVFALEQEGLLLRIPGDTEDHFQATYDLLGGHIIAKSLLADRSKDSFVAWLRQPSTTVRFNGDYNSRHPLADDILRSLVEQVPRLLAGVQLWREVDTSLRRDALGWSAFLPAQYIDAETVDAVLQVACQGDDLILSRIREVRSIPTHPLNAVALDRALRGLTVAQRDLRWTEWLRSSSLDSPANHFSIVEDLKTLETHWRTGAHSQGDQLRAMWVMWTLTSTVREVRDQATHTLYCFGCVDPQGLFELCIDALSINDAYVGERMLAASYGVVTRHQVATPVFANTLNVFLEKLAASLVGTSASAPIAHFLMRLYVRGIIEFALRFYESTLPLAFRDTWDFAAPAPDPVLSKADPGGGEANLPISMDFANYTVGRLFDDRRNYDMGHPGQQAALDHIRGTIWALGWRATSFAELDRDIAEEAYRYTRGDRPRIERYGKKYGWIGLYKYVGLFDTQQSAIRRDQTFAATVIDPTFPEQPSVDGEQTLRLAWLSPSVTSAEKWAIETTTVLPDTVFVRKQIGVHKGPWVAVHGFLVAVDKDLARQVWTFLTALVTPHSTADRLVNAMERGIQPSVCRDVPQEFYTFAGEIPWHPCFGQRIFENSDGDNPYEEVVCVDNHKIIVEVLAHQYVWERSQGETGRVGRALVPSRQLSQFFGLVGVPQRFDQYLLDGTPATITLSGVDGLEGDILYVREDLLRHYVGDRTVVWHAFGDRELRPFPTSPEQSFIEAARQQKTEWRQVLTEAGLRDLFEHFVAQPTKKQVTKRGAKPRRSQKGRKQFGTTTNKRSNKRS